MNAVRKERFEFRLPEAAKRRIEEAAVISKVSVSQFVMSLRLLELKQLLMNIAA